MEKNPKESSYSLTTALVKLGDILKIISEDSKLYYLKSASEVDDTLLSHIAISFATLSNLFYGFIEQWFNSRLKGPDAIQSSDDLKERIDIKLFETGKLDFEQMKKIMTRMNRNDDGIMGLNRMIFYINYFENLCREKKLVKLVECAKSFRIPCLEEARETLTTENHRLKNQIERCNLYYQPAIKTKAVKIALISLAISSLSFLLAILSVFKLI